MKEIWKDIKGYEGIYQISNFGRVKLLLYRNYKNCIRKPKIMACNDNGNGYKYVSLVKNGKRKHYYIHRLVAETFIENVENKEQVNHIDYDRSNNIINNLEWCTFKENIAHSKPNYKTEHICKTNTGERYISCKKDGVYEVSIKRKYYGRFKEISDAIKRRNEALYENNIAI